MLSMSEEELNSTVNINGNINIKEEDKAGVALLHSEGLRNQVMRPSRRRQIKVGSSIVLSSEKIKKFSDSKDQPSVMSKPLDVSAVRLVQRWWRKVRAIIAAEHAASRIKRWWHRRLNIFRSRILMGGRWSVRQAQIIQALVLGWRARRLMASRMISAKVKAIKDVQKVILDVVEPYLLSTQSQSFCVVSTTAELIACSNGTLGFRNITSADWTFVKSLLRELLTALTAFYDNIFSRAAWCKYPAPGAWWLPAAPITNNASRRKRPTSIVTENDTAYKYSFARGASGFISPQSVRQPKTPGIEDSSDEIIEGDHIGSIYLNDYDHLHSSHSDTSRPTARDNSASSAVIEQYEVVSEAVPVIDTHTGEEGQSSIDNSSCLEPENSTGSDREVSRVSGISSNGGPLPQGHGTTISTSLLIKLGKLSPRESSGFNSQQQGLHRERVSIDDNRPIRPMTTEAMLAAESNEANLLASTNMSASRFTSPSSSDNASSVLFQESVKSTIRDISPSSSSGIGSSLKKSARVASTPPSVSSSQQVSHQGLTSYTTPISGGTGKLGSATQASSSPKRKGTRAHIQLDMLSAEKLMLARKGAPLRDGLGEPIADRKPGLRITLYLPPVPGSLVANTNGASDMKKVHHISKDFEEVTQNPRWGSTFYLPLPCPKQLLPQLSNAEKLNLLADDTPLEDAGVIAGQIDGKQLLRRIDICKGLLNWWGEGFIKIAVVDGERFNQEIFLGEVTIYMSSFLVPVRGRERLEMSGTFTLNKQQSTDRVSGSVKLHSYLHLPEFSHLAELYGIGVTSAPTSNVFGTSPTSSGFHGMTSGSPGNTVFEFEKSLDDSFLQAETAVVPLKQSVTPSRSPRSADRMAAPRRPPAAQVTPTHILSSASQSTPPGSVHYSSGGIASMTATGAGSSDRIAQISSVTKCLDSLAALNLPWDEDSIVGNISRSKKFLPDSHIVDDASTGTTKVGSRLSDTRGGEIPEFPQPERSLPATASSITNAAMSSIQQLKLRQTRKASDLDTHTNLEPQSNLNELRLSDSTSPRLFEQALAEAAPAVRHRRVICITENLDASDSDNAEESELLAVPAEQLNISSGFIDNQILTSIPDSGAIRIDTASPGSGKVSVNPSRDGLGQLSRVAAVKAALALVDAAAVDSKALIANLRAARESSSASRSQLPSRLDENTRPDDILQTRNPAFGLRRRSHANDSVESTSTVYMEGINQYATPNKSVLLGDQECQSSEKSSESSSVIIGMDDSRDDSSGSSHESESSDSDEDKLEKMLSQGFKLEDLV